MSDTLQRRFLSGGTRALSTLIVLTILMGVLAESAFSAPPSRRKTNAGETTSSSPEIDGSRGNSGTRPRDGRSRRVRETNNGALPELETSFFELPEGTDDARNWLDPEKSNELRAKALEAGKLCRSTWPEFPEIDENKVKALKMRVIERGHIRLYTDLPKSDDVDQIPEALDAAIPHICKFFEIDASRFDNLRVEAFLMSDVNSFIDIHALNGEPRFLYGYSMGDRIFAKDQKLGYYNRFLLLHELVHTLMHEIFGDLRPRWYSEGSAEYLALHEWDPKRKEIKIAQIPKSYEATPGFGRLRQIQEIVKENRAPTLYRIINFEPQDFVDVSTYSWSWALVMFLNNSPKYKGIAELLPYWSLTDEPNRLFVEAIGDRWNELENDWADFIGRIDYNYDFDASSVGEAIAVSSTGEVGNGAIVEIAADRGWQNTGLRLDANSSYKMTCAGRFKFYLSGPDRLFNFEGTGATVQYVNGKPIGRLEAVVVPDSDATSFYDIYGFDEEQNERLPNSSGFRFNAFQHMRTNADRTRFGENSSGFEDEGTFSSSKVSDRLYNALYPWNSGVEFSNSTTTYTPTQSGVLYMRINAVPKDLKRNSGSVKVQVKLM
ncbi:MAG: hypothetical protein IJM54_06470 [Thermoguttaceae bacterium]|nr:hypothetical protein [Thermoguttaceae bacterium]